MRIVIALALVALTGCSSIRPHITCDLKGNAALMQSTMGFASVQDLNDANRLCEPLKEAAKKDK
jgi:uncharacterized protein YceK